MFSKILLKLVDEAIVPALFLITVRIVSLVLISQYFGISFKTGQGGFIFESQSDYVLVNTYSVMYMFLALFIGLLHTIIKSTVFHNTHVYPPLAAKLYTMKMDHLIQGSFHLYSQGFIWLAYLYILTLGAGIMTVFGTLQGWIVYVAFILSIAVTYMFVLDAEKEVFAGGRRR